MLKCMIVNVTMKSQLSLDLPCKPSIGDTLPTKYMNETVNKVCFVTPMLLKDQPDLKEHDLVVFIG